MCAARYGNQRRGVSQASAKTDVLDCIIYGYTVTFYDSFDSEIGRSHNKSLIRDESYNYSRLELDEVHFVEFSSITVAKFRGIHRCIVLFIIITINRLMM